MKKCIAIIGVSILTAWTAAADDLPKAGAYLGYQYVRFMPGGIVPDFSANGGGGQFIFHANHWLGAVLDVGAVHKATSATSTWIARLSISWRGPASRLPDRSASRRTFRRCLAVSMGHPAHGCSVHRS